MAIKKQKQTLESKRFTYDELRFALTSAISFERNCPMNKESQKSISTDARYWIERTLAYRRMIEGLNKPDIVPKPKRDEYPYAAYPKAEAVVFRVYAVLRDQLDELDKNAASKHGRSLWKQVWKDAVLDESVKQLREHIDKTKGNWRLVKDAITRTVIERYKKNPPKDASKVNFLCPAALRHSGLRVGIPLYDEAVISIAKKAKTAKTRIATKPKRRENK
jgi:dipeptidase